MDSARTGATTPQESNVYHASFKTKAGKQQLSLAGREVSEGKSEVKSYELSCLIEQNAFQGVDPKNKKEFDDVIKNLLQENKVSISKSGYCIKTEKVEDISKFLFSAKNCNLISDKESLSLQNFIRSAKEDMEEPDIDENVASGIATSFAENLCEMPQDNPFSKTDLVIIKDSYTGSLPKNGIKESEFKKVCGLFDKIGKNETYIKLIQEDEHTPVILEAIKMLLTRDVGRRLIEKCASNEKYGVQIKSSPESGYTRGQGLIEMDMSERFIYPALMPDGTKEWGGNLFPLHVALAHEMVHHLHFVDSAKSQTGSPTLGEEYDNLEEQVTITGFYNEPDKSAGHDESGYDEINEWVILNAFTDSTNNYFPRFGHGGMDIDRHRSKYIEIISTQIANLAEKGPVIRFLQFLLERKKIFIEQEPNLLNVVRKHIEELTVASGQPEHPKYLELQPSKAKNLLAEVQALPEQRKAFIGIKENALAELRRPPVKYDLLELWSNDRDFIIAAVKMDPKNFEFAGSELRKDKEFIKALLIEKEEVFVHLDPEIRSNLVKGGSVKSHWLKWLNDEPFPLKSLGPKNPDELIEYIRENKIVNIDCTGVAGLDGLFLQKLFENQPNLASLTIDPQQLKYARDWPLLKSLTSFKINEGLWDGVRTEPLYLLGNSCPNLLSIDLGDLRYAREEDLKMFARKCKGIKEFKCMLDLEKEQVIDLAKSLTDLEVVRNKFAGEDQIAAFIENCPNLMFLDCKLNDHHLELMSKYSHNLVTLSIEDGIDFENVLKIAKNSPHLKKILLNGRESNLKDSHLNQLKEFCSQLESVKFLGATITATGCLEIAKACSLKSMTVGPPASFKEDAVVVELAKNCPDLEELQTVLTGITDVGLKGFAQSCAHLKKITILEMNNPNFTLESIPDLIEHNPELEKFSFWSDVPVTAACIKSLGKCKNLKEITIHNLKAGKFSLEENCFKITDLVELVNACENLKKIDLDAIDYSITGQRQEEFNSAVEIIKKLRPEVEIYFGRPSGIFD